MFFQSPDDGIKINDKTYLEWAREAVAYARTQCPLGAANNLLDMLKAQQNNQAKKLVDKTSRWQKETKIYSGAALATRTLTRNDINLAAKKAREIQASSCVGLSCLAYQYLIEHAVTHVELISLQDGDHMFLLLGRDSLYPPVLSGESDLKVDACVVCDPWANKVYLAEEFEKEKQLSSVMEAIKEIKQIRDEFKVDMSRAREMYILKYAIPQFDYLNGTPRICYSAARQTTELPRSTL